MDPQRGAPADQTDYGVSVFSELSPAPLAFELMTSLRICAGGFLEPTAPIIFLPQLNPALRRKNGSFSSSAIRRLARSAEALSTQRLAKSMLRCPQSHCFTAKSEPQKGEGESYRRHLLPFLDTKTKEGVSRSLLYSRENGGKHFFS